MRNVNHPWDANSWADAMDLLIFLIGPPDQSQRGATGQAWRWFVWSCVETDRHSQSALGGTLHVECMESIRPVGRMEGMTVERLREFVDALSYGYDQPVGLGVVSATGESVRLTVHMPDDWPWRRKGKASEVKYDLRQIDPDILKRKVWPDLYPPVVHLRDADLCA